MKLEEYLQKKYSKSTLASNLYNIKRFTNYYQNKSETATYTDILNYIAHLRKNYDLHPKTLRHCLFGVKIYFNYLLEIGKRKDHPCSELFLKDKINKQIQVDNLYSLETLENFLKTFEIKRKERLKRRNEVIITLLIYQALTVSEISNLEVENIDLESGEIQIKSGHHQQKRKLPLQAKQILLFYNYLEKERKELLLFNKENPVISYLILGQYGEKINPHTISKMINEYRKPSEKLQPMKIRQSVIANLLKKENDTRIVQVFSGHRRASTTIQYKQTELEALQNAVNQYHPIR
jgi:site-specific recombinase XerD